MANNNSDLRSPLLGLSKNELQEIVTHMGEQSFRAGQIYKWLYTQNVSDFSEMTNLSEPFRDELSERFYVSGLTIADKLTSEDGTTSKFLFKLIDGEMIESVWIPDGERRTICISSQVGCALKCSFCATGKMGYKRNLTAAEIVDQVLTAARQAGELPTNIVFMGMGEPFHNYESTMKAAELFNDPDGINIGARKITISTAGLGDKIEQFFKEYRKFKLAISLNSGTEDTRHSLMPISKKYPMTTLSKIIRDNHKKPMQPITFEYILIENVTDTEEEINALIKYAKLLPVKINLIPHNPIAKSTSSPDRINIDRIYNKIKTTGIKVTVRWSKGTDIAAACGQLYSENAS